MTMKSAISRVDLMDLYGSFSSRRGLVAGANVFRSFVAQEGDTEVKKEVSSVIFGSSVAAVGEPEHSPTVPTGPDPLGSMGPMDSAI